MSSCNTCSQKAVILTCAGCKSVAYCSIECQKRDFKKHKKDCSNCKDEAEVPSCGKSSSEESGKPAEASAVGGDASSESSTKAAVVAEEVPMVLKDGKMYRVDDPALTIKLMQGLFRRGHPTCGDTLRCRSCHPELYFTGRDQDFVNLAIDETLGGFGSQVYCYSSLFVTQYIVADVIATIQARQPVDITKGRNILLDCQIMAHFLDCIGGGPDEVVLKIRDKDSDRVIDAGLIRTAIIANKDHIEQAFEFCSGRSYYFEGLLMDTAEKEGDLIFRFLWGS